MHYTHVVGVLGAPDAGKTAALVSLYLLLANSKLGEFAFSDSTSLMDFDRLSRGARKWTLGAMPEQMTGHTELGDGRGPGFLHLRVRRRHGVYRKHDILLPDLPGEWTKQLIDKNVTSRLAFLRRADAFWVFVDGRRLADVSTCNSAIHRTSLLFDRIRQFIDPTAAPPIFLVITRSDSYGELPPGALERLRAGAADLGLTFEAVEIASFSNSTSVPAGAGLDRLLGQTLSPRAQPIPPAMPRLRNTRHVLRYQA